MQAAQQQQRQPLAQIPIAQPMQFPVSTSSSLEDIIRKALMNPQSESPPPDIRRLQDQQSGLIPPKYDILEIEILFPVIEYIFLGICVKNELLSGVKFKC